jgi:DNA-binding transcriptional ArsR family regulator
MGADGNPAKSVALMEIQDSRKSMSKEDRAEDVVKDEYHKIVENFGENWVSRRVLKEAVSIELGVSQRTADRHIKRLVDVQQFLIDNNKLCKGWT